MPLGTQLLNMKQVHVKIMLKATVNNTTPNNTNKTCNMCLRRSFIKENQIREYTFGNEYMEMYAHREIRYGENRQKTKKHTTSKKLTNY